MAGDQHRHYWALAKIKWNGHYSGHCRPIHKDDPIKSNNNEHIIRINHKIYRDDIWKLHRIPKKILSNRGPQFTSKFMEKFTKVLGTMRQLSIAYYPQTDSQMEWINQKIGTFLWHYMNYQQDNWTDWLAAAEFQYNDKKHAVTGRTPFKLNFRRHSWKEDLMV